MPKLYQYQELAYVNVFPTTVPIISNISTQVIYTKSFQYDSYMDTVMAPGSIFTERAQVDKFPPVYPAKIYDVRRQQYTFASYFFEDVGLRGVAVISGQDITIYRKRVILYQSLFNPSTTTFKETIFIDKTPPQFPSKVYDVKRNQYLYPGLFIDAKILTQAEAVSLDKWLGYHPDKIFTVKNNNEYIYILVTEPVTTTTIRNQVRYMMRRGLTRRMRN